MRKQSISETVGPWVFVPWRPVWPAITAILDVLRHHSRKFISSFTMALLVGCAALAPANSQAQSTWTGLGSDNNWSTAGNWNNNAEPIFPTGLTFAGSTRLANDNDLTGITVTNITFDAAAGAFVLGGNGITLSGNLDFSGNPATPITQTVNLGMAWSTDETIDTPTNGNLTLGGAITSGDNLFKFDAGTLTLGGTNTIESLDIDGGTNIITGNTTINGNGIGYDRLYDSRI